MKKIFIFLALIVSLATNSVFAVSKPKISVSNSFLVFGKVLRGNEKTLEFFIKTKTNVSLKTDKLWITLDSSALKTSGKVKVLIRGSLLPVGIDHTGTITVSAIGYDPTIVKVSVSTEKNIELKMKIDSKTATLNGRSINVKSPMRMKGCTPLVPLRFVNDVLGAKTYYNPKDSSITITRLDRIIELLPDLEEYIVNGKKRISNPAPTFYDGVMFVPLGFLSSAFGICINWDRTGQQGTIKLCD
ncbi:MAG: copper amine oxidase N-terminal domain-containing protein [Caldiserica bacterium]|nr:copper amine oxidase N-terminal domain-containing protein [Caldisericota bacterium]